MYYNINMKKRSIRIYFNAPITLLFVVICLFALALNSYTGGRSNALIFSCYKSSWTDPLTYVRLICHVFGHQSINHLISNALYILLLGPILEEKYGSKLIFVIIVTAIITGITHNFLSSDTALLGASSIAFAFILLASFTGKNNGIPITFILVAVLWLGSEIVNIFTADNISQVAHIVGGLCGALLAFFLK